MTAFPSRTTLRAAVLAAVAAGAVLVPSAAAFADASPRPSAPAEVTLSPERSKAAAEAPKEAAPAVTPRGGVAAGDRPAPAPKEAAPAEPAPAVTPRGGVAAGERPVGSGDNSTALLAGSAAGAALLAGAGTLVLRRRSAAGRNG
ncbi:hypothetical protein [Streptomyces badius]|uniref:Tat pathway signal sequence domain protein n=1 Tax=Streptomyces badius TaxID=1941 RepID=A0ABQ2SSW0_STRBA|nr:hypothetical protein [Streptomyces badius]GGS39375.1 hypothetical protein GCM10010253_11380 [Streptomyces badius]